MAGKIRRWRYTTLSREEIQAFVAQDPKRRAEWSKSLYEHVLTMENSLQLIYAHDNSTVLETPSTANISADGTITTIQSGEGYNGAAPGLWLVRPGQQGRNAIIRYIPPWPQAHGVCLGLYVRLWFGGSKASGSGYAPSNRQDLMKSTARGCKYEVWSGDSTGHGSSDDDYAKLIDSSADRHAPGCAFFFSRTSSETGDLNYTFGRNSSGNYTSFVDVPISGSVEGASGCCIFMTVHLVYRWCPGLQGSTTIAWPMPSPIPLQMTKETGNSLRAAVKWPEGGISNYRSKCRIVLFDEQGEYRTDSAGVIDLNGGKISVYSPYTATFDRALFNDYPNSAVIHGVVQLWNYWPDNFDNYNGTNTPIAYNLNNEPTESGFRLELPENSASKPTAGALTTSVIPHDFQIAGVYAQHRTGVQIRMAAPTTQINATIAEMRVEYYGGTASSKDASAEYSFTRNADGTWTFRLDRLLVNGSATFSAYVVDSRGFTPAKRTATIIVHPYSAPEITEIVLLRADQDGKENLNGVYGAVKVSASVSSVNGKNKIERLCAAIRAYEPNIDWEHAADVLLTNGGQKILSDDLDPGKLYRVRIRVTDMVGVTTTCYRTLQTAAYTIHLNQGGNGVGLGEAARNQHTLSIADDWDLFAHGGRLMDLLVPIGSVQTYTRRSDETEINPNELYMGTVWVRVTDRLLKASGKISSDSEGGAETVMIGTENVPQLPVTYLYGAYAYDRGYAYPYANQGYGFGGIIAPDGGTGVGQWSGRDFLAGAAANAGNTAPAPVEHLPPYYVVDVWKRIG